jgi:hypothetical protein
LCAKYGLVCGGDCFLAAAAEVDAFVLIGDVDQDAFLESFGCPEGTLLKA